MSVGAGSSDFKLEAYKTLRAEIGHHVQAMAASVGVALTAVGAIGAFALSEPGNRDALLVLPFVLSGLALVQINHGIQIRRRDEYIRTYLWPSKECLPPTSHGLLPVVSWEEWIATIRLDQSALNPAKVADAVGYVIVFGFPSAGALALTASVAWGKASLAIVWGLAVLVMLMSAAIGLAVESKELAPSDRYPHRSLRPPRRRSQG
jgi:hypothetical protein